MYIGIQWADGIWASRGVYVGYDDEIGAWFWEMRNGEGKVADEYTTRHAGFPYRINAIDSAYETIRGSRFGAHLDLTHLKRYTSRRMQRT